MKGALGVIVLVVASGWLAGCVWLEPLGPIRVNLAHVDFTNLTRPIVSIEIVNVGDDSAEVYDGDIGGSLLNESSHAVALLLPTWHAEKDQAIFRYDGDVLLPNGTRVLMSSPFFEAPFILQPREHANLTMITIVRDGQGEPHVNNTNIFAYHLRVEYRADGRDYEWRRRFPCIDPLGQRHEWSNLCDIYHARSRSVQPDA